MLKEQPLLSKIPLSHRNFILSLPKLINKSYSAAQFTLNGNICHRCHEKVSAKWRKGPNGTNTLCNGCGIYYSKLIRRHGIDKANGKIFNFTQDLVWKNPSSFG